MRKATCILFKMLRCVLKRLPSCLTSSNQPSCLFLHRGLAAGKPSGDLGEGERIRNVGIMAHIDAGKTTTTERMLYYSGFTRRMGDVDSGNTVMDYLQQERERGITINSAAISFQWLEHRLNLIDTPGHVDFTFEVERSLRVLDGAVVLLDGAAGVEAQTLTVWRQANQHSIPRIIFINKMDKPGASYVDSVRSMEDKLRTTPLVTQLPLGSGREFTGVIDLLTMDLLVQDMKYKNFSKLGRLSELVKTTPISRERLEEALEARYNLAEQVVTLDSKLLEMVSDDSFDPLVLRDDLLRPALRRLTLNQSATPVLCGSSQKKIGVQPLMDAIVNYLPCPDEKQVSVPEALKDLYAYAFKVTYDKRRGHLVYLRLYSGVLKPQTTVHNISRNASERVTRLILMLADEQKEVPSMRKGNIVVAVGMKNTYTGDTIVQSVTAASAALEDMKRSHGQTEMTDNFSSREDAEIGKLEVPPPVFFCSVESASASQQKELDHALSCLTREDPSLRVTVNEDTGQTVLSGMGELHLEIIHDKLTRDYGIDCSLGELQVAYREAPTVSVTKDASLDQTVGGKRYTVSLTLSLESESCSNHGDKPSVYLEIGKALPGLGYSKQEVVDALLAGVQSACLQGPLLAFPVQNVSVSLTSLTLGSTTPLPFLSSCVAEGVAKALREADVQLLEPCTELVVTVPDEHLGSVLSDLTSQRRAQVKDVSVAMDTRVIQALIPLSCLVGYSTTLRTMTSGSATFMATFSHYEPVNREYEKQLIAKIRGYII